MKSGFKFTVRGFFLFLLVGAFSVLAFADPPHFHMAWSSNPSGDTSWQQQVGDFTEFDFDNFPGNIRIDGLQTDDVYIDIDLGGLNGTYETVGFFQSSAFSTYGTIYGNALLSYGQSHYHSQIIFEFSEPVAGAGVWIFDDSTSYIEGFFMHIVDGNGQSWTTHPALFDSGNLSSLAVEGFLGVISPVGIKSIAIENVLLPSWDPLAAAFEIDHLQVGGVVVSNNSPIADAGANETIHIFELATLDGSGSSDPDGHSLIYHWEIVDQPEGSDASLDDPASPTPSFLLDAVGDFMIKLIVTDSEGAESAPDYVQISSFNTAPVADAGPDQAIIELETTVELDGSQSYDNDGDEFSLLWEIVQKPAGSTAQLSDATISNPTFIADVQGNYVIRLEATDVYLAQSDPDSVTVSFTNVEPVADAGDNHSVLVYTTVELDGGNSHDANLDPLTYAWSFVSKPEGSEATLMGADSQVAQYTADLSGEYIVSLVVNDGSTDSFPSTVTVLAVVDPSSVALKLQETIDAINALDKSHFKNNNLKKALTSKLNAAMKKLDSGLYLDALDKLVNDVLKKMDGCATEGATDKNDWITTCDGQVAVYPLAVEAIDLLDFLINS